MFYVYLIRSVSFLDKVYIGMTKDLKKRLEVHNTGGSVYIKIQTMGINSLCGL